MTTDTNTQIIPIISKQIENRETETINARDLHAFLEVGRDFSNWIKGRIKKYGFQENQDFISFAKTGEREIGASIRIEYHLTLDMAKELSMVERTEKGRQARQYFIQCEKELRQKKEAISKEASIDSGSRAQGFRAGISLARCLQKHTLDLADAVKICWYRKNNLTQKETAKLFEIEHHKIQEIEKTLRTLGIFLPAINGQKRAKEMRHTMDSLLGSPEDFLLIQGGI